MKAGANQSQQRHHGEMDVTWWVSRGSARWASPLSRGGGVTVWAVARFQALTLRFGSFTHDMGSSKVSLTLSLSPLTLSVLPLSLRFSFPFFFSLMFFHLGLGDWSLRSDCWVYIFGLNPLSFYMWAGLLGGVQAFCKGLKSHFFFFS